MNPIESLPFYHGSCPNKTNGGFPSSMPISIEFDRELKMFRTRPSNKLKEVLNKVYLSGSLVDGSISNESGAVYLMDLVNFLVNQSKVSEEEILLEIGYGKGVILKELSKLGYTNLIGIEPGNHAHLPGMNDIETINDFFPSDKLKTKVDLLYHFAVWEHVEDPVDFLSIQLDHITKDGCIVFGVPNCEPYIQEGDISMFIHEHYSYFTSESISRCVEKAGGELVSIETIKGMLVGRIIKRKVDFRAKNLSKTKIDYNKFWDDAEIRHSKLDKFFTAFSNEVDVAVYVPGRALNTLSTLGRKKVRLVDDNSEMTNRYLPYFENSIESFGQLCANPPKAILVFSTTFGNIIKDKCKKDSRLASCTIVSLNDL